MDTMTHELDGLARSIARQHGVDFDAPKTHRERWRDRAARVVLEAQPKVTIDHDREDTGVPALLGAVFIVVSVVIVAVLYAVGILK